MNGKKPTRDQRPIFTHNGLDPRDWLVQKNTLDSLQVIHKETHEIRVLNKER